MSKKLFFTCLVAFGLILTSCGGQGSSEQPSSNSEAITPVSIAITGTSTVKVGATVQLSAVVSPTGASQQVTWSSLSEDKATVSASGLVTGVAAGSVTIRATSTTATTIKGDITLTVEPAEVAEGVTPKGVEHTLVDNRGEAYVAYAPNGTELGRFPSLYEAINLTVDEGDRGSYVTKLNGEDKDVVMFVNNETYDSNLGDQFWYYQNGNQVSAYVPWRNTYFQDSRALQSTVIMNSPTDGVLTYYNGYELLHTNPEDASSNQLAVWSVQKYLESAATVNLVAYSGITKAVYDIDLTDVKIAPSLNENQQTEAFFGFYSTDAYNTSHQHLRADTRTGDWYYAAGEFNFDSSSYTYSTDKTVGIMTSTWNEEGGYFVPDEDRVIITFEKLTIEDNEGGEYIVDRIIFEFPETGRKVIRDYEISALTQCGTLRFVNGLDIMTDGVMAPDYMNGSYFTGLAVTEATVYAFEEMQDPLAYGNVAVLDAGEYDVLNANEASAARYQTIMYNPAFNELEIVDGKDVYSHSYTADTNNSAYNDAITNVKTMIGSLKEPGEIVAADEAVIVATRAAFDALHLYEKDFITVEEKTKLSDVEVALAVATDPELGAILGVLSNLGSVMSQKDYATVAGKKAQVDGMVDAYEALSEVSKANLGADVAEQINDWKLAVNAPVDAALATSFETIFNVVLAKTFDGIAVTDWNIDGSAYVWEGAGAGLNGLVYVAGAGRTAFEALNAADIELPASLLKDINEPITYDNGKHSFNIGLRFLKAYGDVCDILDQIAAAAGWKAAWQLPFADYQGYSNNADLSVTKNGQDTTNLDFDAIRPQLDKIAEYWNDEHIETWNFKNSVGVRTVTIARRWDGYLKPILADARCPYQLAGHGLALKAA